MQPIPAHAQSGNTLDKVYKLMKKLVFVITFIWSTLALAQLPQEPLGKIQTLPDRYPPHWIIAVDVSFFHIRDGKSFILDADAETAPEQFKGMLSTSLAAPFAQSATRSEMYVADVFYSRGTRGERTDVLTIYDKSTLLPIDEVILKGHRAVVLPNKFFMQLTGDESLLLIYNFSPAMSVSVVDIDERKFVGEVPIPGCSTILPTGQRSFSSLCGDGTLYTVNLDETGAVAGTSRTGKFFDPDVDPVIEKPAWHQGKAWFPSFQGEVYPVDFTGDEPVVGEPWSMLDDATRGWRPGAPAPSAADASGRIYFLTHPDGREGSHRDPGVEVWVFDPSTGERLARRELQMPGLNVALTRDSDAPLMIVTNVEMGLDVYDANTGSYIRTLSGFGEQTPLLVFGAE